MKHRLPLFPALLLLFACRSDMSAPHIQPGQSFRSRVPPASASTVTLSVEERRLIADLVALYPKGRPQAVIGAAMSDPFQIGAKTPQNPRAQSIIDQIDAIRRARVDSIARAQADAPPSSYSATIVLVPRLSEPGASAVVWRRVNRIPHDVIVLEKQRITIGALGSAVQALVTLRKSGGDVPAVDEHVVVRGERIPKRWDNVMIAVAANDLKELQRASPLQVDVFGSVPTRTIDFPPLGPRATKP